MPQDKKPTIQIKTASPACPDIVGDWAMGQKNPNESVKYLIIQMAACFGNADIFDPVMINQLNSMLTRNGAGRIETPVRKERSPLSNSLEEKAEAAQPAPETASIKKQAATKKKLGTRLGTEPIGNMDIFDLKFIDNLDSMLSKKESAKTAPAIRKENNLKPNEEKLKAEPDLQEVMEETAAREDKKTEKNVKKKVTVRPGTAPNIMQ